MEMLIQLSQRTTVPNEAYLQREILDILDAYHSVSLKHLDLGQLLLELTGLLREHRLQLPTDLAIMIRALVTAEGTARQIYPDLNVVEEAEGYVKALAMERWKPAELMRNLRRTLRHMGVLHRQLPMRVFQIVEKVERGELSVRFQHENLGDFRRSIENSSSRLTLGIIIASMIIGSSMVITTGVEPFLFGFPAFGILGYMISGVLGLWLVFNIIRSRKY
jgi:ubiquinone biosynthesis protein